MKKIESEARILQAAKQMLWAVEKLKLQSDYWVTATNNLRQAILSAEQQTAQAEQQEPTIDHDKLHEMNMQYVYCPACGSDMAQAYSPKNQAEQEPDYFGLTHDHTWLSIDKKQYDKLKPERRMACYTAPPQQVTRADLKAAFKEGFERAADLYAPNDGQEPYAYEVWDVQDQSFTMIYATQLKEFHWIEPENIARVLYAAPVSIEAAVLAEREACAMVCDDIGDSDNGYGCAAAIRARSEK